ncbi:MAG: solute carrier family 26 protein [Bacteroidota bacterium]
MSVQKYFPILENFSSHSQKEWRKDLIAGITVAVMLVPQGMAYSMLAGMPPIYGLYAGLIPLLLYAVLGTSRQMSIGPVAVSALLVMAGVSQIAEPFTYEYISLVILTGLLIGVLQTLLGFFRLGFLVNFISRPVIIGFTSAAAIIIAISQLKDLLGFSIPRFSHLYETALYACQHLTETNWVAVVMCLGSIAIMLILRKINRAIPGPLLVVVIGTVLTYYLGEDQLGIDVVREVPQGLPGFQLPELSWKNISILIPTVLTVTIIGIVESIGIAKVLQSKHGNYKIRPNQELRALGISKITGSFFQAIPSSGSFTRSAVNNEAGAQSGIASIFTALLIGLTLLFLTPLFYFLPKTILAAIILLSVKSLFEFEEAKELWHSNTGDFCMMLTTFLVTLILGIEEGVLAGVVLSIAVVLYKSAKPHMAVLGKLPNSTSYLNVNRYEMAEKVEGALILRFDDQLYFANASYFLDSVQQFVDDDQELLRLFVLDASNIHNVDSTGVHALEDVYKFLKKRKITFYISGLVGPVRDRLSKAGFLEKMGDGSLFLDIHNAIADYEKRGT